MSSVLKFLGTSDSKGVPRMLCNCVVCKERKIIRTRPSVCIHTDHGLVLIDTSPDFREQFLKYENGEIPRIVFITHAHNDHIAGLGDYADLCLWYHADSQIVSPRDVNQILLDRYPYLAKREELRFVEETTWQLEDWDVSFHKVNHGFHGHSYGIRFQGQGGKWAYIPDSFYVSDDQWQPFYDLDLLILGTAYWEEDERPLTRCVYNVVEGLEIKSKLRAKKVIFTHMSHNVDTFHPRFELPNDVLFAYDGMEVDLTCNGK